MLFSFYISLSLLALVFCIAILARATSHRKLSIGIALYLEALRDENNGHFEEAVTAYEAVLVQCKKIRFQRVFRNKITGKVKLLHTIIDYDKSTRYIR